MPYIKKPPEVVSLKLEQPVCELLDDYSRFVECSPDHVTNLVLRTARETGAKDADPRRRTADFGCGTAPSSRGDHFSQTGGRT
jgi:hypothetical protein